MTLVSFFEILLDLTSRKMLHSCRVKVQWFLTQYANAKGIIIEGPLNNGNSIFALDANEGQRATYRVCIHLENSFEDVDL